MPRSRQTNVTAARWSPNGSALGSVDLTEPFSYPHGENVFSAAVQRHKLPKDVYKRLQRVLEQGEPLDPALADSVALAMKEWALEKGATHYTHWFQPLTGSTAEKHDSFYAPTGDGRAEERVVLLGGQAGQRLEDVRVVGRALLERPLLHRERDRVG